MNILQKKCLLIIFMTIPTIFTFAQRGGASPIAPPVQGANNGLISSNARYGSKAGNQEITYKEALAEYANFQGSPFLHGEEIVVDLIYYNDSLLEQVPILYDLYNQEITATTKKGEQITLNQIYYKGFYYDNKGVKELYQKVNPAKPLKFYKILFKNEDFVFCSNVKVTVAENTRYIPGQERVGKGFVSVKNYYIIKDRKAAVVRLKKEGLVADLQEKYQTQIPDLKKKLKLKKLNKEKDYILLMKAFDD